MSLRLIGEYVHLSVGALAVPEFAVCRMVFVFADAVRFGSDLPAFAQSSVPASGPLFGGIMLSCLLAFGRYSVRQRARGLGIFIHVIAALIAGIALTAMAYYAVPVL